MDFEQRVQGFVRENAITPSCAERALESYGFLVPSSFSPVVTAADGEINVLWYAGGFSLELSIPKPVEQIYVRRKLPYEEEVAFIDKVGTREREALRALEHVVNGGMEDAHQTSSR